MRLKGSITTWVPESWEEGQRWKKERQKYRRLRITRGAERKQLEGEQMAERGRMGRQGRIKRRTGTAGEQRRETEKEVGNSSTKWSGNS